MEEHPGATWLSQKSNFLVPVCDSRRAQVMLNCILGMVEKTQSALTILQQRQSEAANLRTTEEAVADVQVPFFTSLKLTKAKYTLLRLEQTWRSWK